MSQKNPQYDECDDDECNNNACLVPRRLPAGFEPTPLDDATTTVEDVINGGDETTT